MAYISFDPYRQRELGRWNHDTDREIERKISLTFSAWKKWKGSEISERTNLLLKLAEVLDSQRQLHAALITTEMGKPVTQSLAEVDKCAFLCRYYAEHIVEFSRERIVYPLTGRGTVRLDPQGIIFGIMPWNFPYWQVFRYLVPALAGGNAAVLKHASNVTMCAMGIYDSVRSAGFPDDLFNVVFPSHSQIEKIISMPEIRGVTLTGSNRAGSTVASLAGRYIKKTVLELGGSDPLIVFAGADIEKATAGAVTGRFQNCGQSCIAAKRILVQDEIYDEFIIGFVNRVKGLKSGDPADPDVFIGPMFSNEAVDEVARQVDESVAMGAQIATGGVRMPVGPAFYEPTVVTSVSKGFPVIDEEVFGPVAPVIPFRNKEEAVTIANSTRFGLGASVWTSDETIAVGVASMLESGCVAVNGFVRSDPDSPFGGVKESGYGRELSREGFAEFLNVKSVTYY